MNELMEEMVADTKEQTISQPFDKEEWIQQKKAEKEKAYEMIEQEAELMVHDTEKIQNYLNLQSRFPRYSVGNILLLSVQKPEATRIGDYRSWRERNVYIRKGETGIIILEPGKEYKRQDGSTAVSYNAKHVFDISQTTAQEYQDPVIQWDRKLLLRALAYNAPCEFKTVDAQELPENIAALYDPGTRCIRVGRDHDYTRIFQHVARELAHAHMDQGDYKREEHEFTAQCVSYILCKRNQVDTEGLFLDPPDTIKSLDSKKMRKELKKIRDIAGDIMTNMERMAEKQKAEMHRDEAR